MIANLELYGEVLADYTLDDLKKQYSSQKASKEINLYINSIGGDVREGFAIHDWLISLNKPITTIVEARCYSIATVPFLSAKKENRLIARNAEIMIHNAWTFSVGNASELEKQTAYLKKTDNQLAEFYSEKLGKDIEEIKALMANETFINSKEAYDLGFAGGEFMFKAVAKIKNEYKMNEEVKSLLNEIKAMFGLIKPNLPKNSPKAMLITLRDGKNIFVYSEDGELEGKQVVLANEDGTPTETPAPDGEHILKDGRKIVVTGGIVTAVMEDESAKMDEMKKEMAQKDAEIAAKSEEVAKKEEEIKALKAKYEVLSKQYEPTLAKLCQLEALIGANKTAPAPQSNVNGMKGLNIGAIKGDSGAKSTQNSMAGLAQNIKNKFGK